LFGTIARSLEFRNQMEKEAMEDQDRLFLLSLVGDLKKVPPHLKMQVKSNIINVISHSLAFQLQRIDFNPRCQLNPLNSYQTLPFLNTHLDSKNLLYLNNHFQHLYKPFRITILNVCLMFNTMIKILIT